MNMIMGYRLFAVAAILGLAFTPAARADVEAPPGCLTLPDGSICPLGHTDVSVDIAGYIARVTVVQTFGNPSSTPIEAVYTFPLSEDGAVDQMEMRIGKRVIKGDVRKREEARAMYEAAKNNGQVASLLDQERPNIFTQSVANIMPGETIQIMISYVEVVPLDEGAYRFSFPMVVGPRYIPAGVSDAERITPPVAKKNTRAGHDISLKVNLDAGMAISKIDSELHAVDVKKRGEGKARISLSAKSEIPNRDFILRYNVRGKDVEDAVLTHADARGGFFTLVLQPPARVETDRVTPKELYFVIDSSGSMRGFPIEKAKATMRKCINEMNPRDTFNLVTFAGGVGYCFDKPVANTKENRKKALRYLENLQGSGGTEMMKAIHAALADQNDPERLRVVCFMTDGYIGNEPQILNAIQKNSGTARVFSFGIGSSVNTFLIENMAREGRGRSEVVTLAADGDAAAKRFGEAVRNPVLTDIEVDYGTLDVYDTLPAVGKIPDLFSEAPIVVHGRYRDAGDGTITVRGNTAEGPFERRIAVSLPKVATGNDALASVWARQKIAAITAENWLASIKGEECHDTVAAITQLGLEYDLVTQYTSFIAIEERVVNKGGRSETIEVPVEMPDGVSREGIFGDSNEAMESLGYLSPAPMPAIQMQKSSSNRPQPQVSRPAPADVGLRVQLETAPASPEPAADAPVIVAEEEASVRDTGASRDRDEAASVSKLSPELLAAARGEALAKDIKVVDGWVEVFISVKDLAKVKALEEAGVRILSTLHSDQMVYAKVQINNLAQVAALELVTKIKPARF